MNPIQSKATIFFTSSATWTMFILFAYNALNANIGLLPNGWTAVVNIVLTILAGILHAYHVQTSAQLGRTN